MSKIKTLNNSSALVLNQGCIPINVIPWSISIVDVLSGKAIVMAEYEDMWINTGRNHASGLSGRFKIPSVIMYPTAPVEKVQYAKTLIPSKENLLKRDHNKCCYCNVKLSLTEATIEHVHPQSKGGLSDWINCRIACSDCNRKKGDKLLSEIGWTLKEAKIPIITGGAAKSIIHKVGGRILDESWRPFIKWEIKWQ